MICIVFERFWFREMFSRPTSKATTVKVQFLIIVNNIHREKGACGQSQTRQKQFTGGHRSLPEFIIFIRIALNLINSIVFQCNFADIDSVRLLCNLPPPALPPLKPKEQNKQQQNGHLSWPHLEEGRVPLWKCTVCTANVHETLMLLKYTKRLKKVIDWWMDWLLKWLVHELTDRFFCSYFHTSRGHLVPGEYYQKLSFKLLLLCTTAVCVRFITPASAFVPENIIKHYEKSYIWSSCSFV